MSTIEVLQPSRGEREVLVNALSSFLPSHHALLAIPGLLEWQHLGGLDKYNFILVRDKRSKKTIAVNGFIPGSFWGEGENSICEVGLVNWYADPGYPGSGLTAMKHIINNLGYRYAYGLGSSSTSESIHRILGYNIFEKQHYVMINQELRNFKVAVIREGHKFDELEASPTRYSTSNVTSLKEFEACPISFWKDRFPHRSPTFYYNRYLRHPWYQYRFEIIFGPNGMVVGIVYRVASCNGVKIIRIVDIVGKHEDFSLVASRVGELLAHYGAEFADYLVWTNQK
ncbi:MAG: hypothetical protein QF535_20730 [Anaerolineales bacterium]|nr:hypothetical protein [Anaerolineales bacterium]